jgi:hypothetical protein
MFLAGVLLKPKEVIALKLKEKTKTRILVLACAIFFFAIHLVSSWVARDGEIERAKKANLASQITVEMRDNKIARAMQDFDESSVLCISAICVYSCAILGYIYFDRREREEQE